MDGQARIDPNTHLCRTFFTGYIYKNPLSKYSHESIGQNYMFPLCLLSFTQTTIFILINWTLSYTCNYIIYLCKMRRMVLGYFGHGHFGHGRFGQDISAMDILATDISANGHFGHGHFGHGIIHSICFCSCES